MKSKELKGFGKEDLKNRLNELKKDLVKLNAQRRTGATMKNPEQLRQMRKTMARILQLLKQKEVQ